MKRNYEQIMSFDWHTIKIPWVINWITGSLIIIGIVIGQRYAPFVAFTSLIKQTPQMLLIFPLLITGYIIMHVTLAPFITLGVGAALLGIIASPAGVWFAVFWGSLNLFASRGDIQAALILKDVANDLFIKDKGDSLYIYKSVD